MPARKGPKKVTRYSLELKRTAVRLSHAPGARVNDVAEALDIHPFMLSRWRKLAREGKLVKRPCVKATATKKKAPSVVQMSKCVFRRCRAGIPIDAGPPFRRMPGHGVKRGSDTIDETLVGVNGPWRARPVSDWRASAFSWNRL